MTTLLLEPFGGLAGDMLLAALLDLERPELTLADLEGFVADLLPGECRLRLSEVQRGSLRARRLDVLTDETRDPPERHLEDLLAILRRSALSAASRVRAEDVLRRIGAAEARVHGTTIERVHFHEVGAVDTLVDVCGASFALERLGVERVLSRPPYAGGGSVRCAHGEMPVPAPGTAAILAELPWIAGTGGERLTPTGAALYASLSDGPPGLFRADAQGYGAGARDPDEGPPNLVRVQLGRTEIETGAGETEADPVLLLAFNLDDATGEEVGFLVRALRAAGALEVWTQAVQMKKDRPGVIVSALGPEGARAALEEAAFAHSPTLGVRWTRWERTVLPRESVAVDVAGESVRVKLRRRPGCERPSRVDLSPEFDDLAALAARTERPLRELEAEAIARALEHLGG